MPVDSRDKIWDKIFDVYYDSYWVEILSDNAIGFWQKTDDITKVLVALTVSGSALSGWALWNQPGFKYIWAIMAGIASVLSITHATLGVAGKLKDWIELKRNFTSLRLELESCRDLMEIDPHFSIDEYENHYKDFKKRFGELYPWMRSDIIITKQRKVKCQIELNKRLGL